MGDSAVQSWGSISSVGTSTQMHDTCCTTNSNATSEFINHGLLLWNQTRNQWIGKRKPEKRFQQLCEPKLRNEKVTLPRFGLAEAIRLRHWNATYDSLLGSSKPFPKPVPLAEMVDFLVDIWEQEGMYD